ncbi:MAG: ACT domain-containing protein, partial [Candidatus Bipolaricaulota bacterium]
FTASSILDKGGIIAEPLRVGGTRAPRLRHRWADARVRGTLPPRGGEMREATVGRELVAILENRVGVLAAIARLLSEQGINILALAVMVHDDRAELHLVPDAPSYALDALRKAEFEVEERDVVLVELPHRAGFLRRITEVLARQGLDIRYLYASAFEAGHSSLVVFSCSNNGKAVQLLREK